MKSILRQSFVLFLIISFVSCDNNDDQVTPDALDPTTTQDGFTYNQNNANSIFYETSNAYIEKDDGNNDAYPLAPDYYSFFFLNGRLYDNDAKLNNTTDEVLVSVNTTQSVILSVDVADNPSLQTGNPPTAGNTYVVSVNDSNVVTNLQVDASSPQTFINIDGTNVEFGEGNGANSTVFGPAATGHSITINAINIDNVTPSNSTIDVDYQFVNTSGELISGHYQGTLGVFED